MDPLSIVNQKLGEVQMSYQHQYALQQIQQAQAMHSCSMCKQTLPVQSFSRKKDQTLYKACKSCIGQLNERKRQQGQLCTACHQFKFINEFCDLTQPNFINPFCNFCMQRMRTGQPQIVQAPQGELLQFMAEK